MRVTRLACRFAMCRVVFLNSFFCLKTTIFHLYDNKKVSNSVEMNPIITNFELYISNSFESRIIKLKPNFKLSKNIEILTCWESGFRNMLNHKTKLRTLPIPGSSTPVLLLCFSVWLITSDVKVLNGEIHFVSLVDSKIALKDLNNLKISSFIIWSFRMGTVQ